MKISYTKYTINDDIICNSLIQTSVRHVSRYVSRTSSDYYLFYTGVTVPLQLSWMFFKHGSHFKS